jgi:hypothetical protein
MGLNLHRIFHTLTDRFAFVPTQCTIAVRAAKCGTPIAVWLFAGQVAD